MELAGQIINSLSFPLKLILGIAFFASVLKRRKRFVLRAVVCTAVILGLSVTMYKPLGNLEISYLLNLIQFALTAFGVWVCFDSSPTQISFVMGLVLALQQIAFNTVTTIYLCIFASRIDAVGAAPDMEIVQFLLHFVHIGFVALLYFVFTRVIFGRYHISEEIMIKNKAVIFIVFSLTVILFVMFHFVYLMKVGSAMLFVYLHIITGITCILAVGYFMSIFNKEELDVEMDTMHRVLKESSRQHGIFKENIDIINRKCHDMKFMLSSLSEKGNSSYIDELRQAVDIYGTMPKTGNAVLDVVLSENFLRSKEAGVDMSCIADGSLLDFMEESDLYALFGNAISNALEAASAAKEDGRFISLYVGMSTAGLIRINIENGYSGEIRFKNGLPLTSKDDESYHGFGMKSIDYIVRKYGGGLAIETENNVFKLAVVLEPQTANAKMSIET